MKTYVVRGVLGILSLSVVWTSSYANMLSRHYTLRRSFNNKVFNTNNNMGYTAKSLIKCSAKCEEDCDCLGFNSRTKKCHIFKACLAEDVTGDELAWKYYIPEYPEDCQELFGGGETTSGVYTIRPPGDRRLVTVYCDMATSGGGWTVIQNRVNGTMNFNRSWEEYRTGFGDAFTSYWIGNAIIHQFTKESSASLYISVTNVDGTSLYIIYDNFSILGEGNQYSLNITGAYSGSLDGIPQGRIQDHWVSVGSEFIRWNIAGAYSGSMGQCGGDSIRNATVRGIINGMKFTTYDQDNDYYTKNCAIRWGGGWWFNDCTDVFLNGLYNPPENWLQPWYPPYMDGKDVARTKMMIRR
ncbi:fibrinogen-like protein A [Ostrea edulis]|uniref:fibrinogen-like protein A n=1 Tax=Ostrea edulis TaxID=37623 RepID=UPI0024AF9FFD|nr:fibrinogen-like protein A [Ostrea edulis]